MACEIMNLRDLYHGTAAAVVATAAGVAPAWLVFAGTVAGSAKGPPATALWGPCSLDGRASANRDSPGEAACPARTIKKCGERETRAHALASDTLDPSASP